MVSAVHSDFTHKVLKDQIRQTRLVKPYGIAWMDECVLAEIQRANIVMVIFR